MRKCLYAAINKLTPIFQGKQQQLAAKQQADATAAIVAATVKAVAPSVPQPIPASTPVVPNGYGATPQVRYTGGPINYGVPSNDPVYNPPYIPPSQPYRKLRRSRRLDLRQLVAAFAFGRVSCNDGSCHGVRCAAAAGSGKETPHAA